MPRAVALAVDRGGRVVVHLRKGTPPLCGAAKGLGRAVLVPARRVFAVFSDVLFVCKGRVEGVACV